MTKQQFNISTSCSITVPVFAALFSTHLFFQLILNCICNQILDGCTLNLFSSLRQVGIFSNNIPGCITCRLALILSLFCFQFKYSCTPSTFTTPHNCYCYLLFSTITSMRYKLLQYNVTQLNVPYCSTNQVINISDETWKEK